LAHLHCVGVQDERSRIPVSLQTVFRIASLTKSFTAFAVLRLRDGGALSLRTSVLNILPGLRVISVSNPATTNRPIQLMDLLTHTAGFVTDDPWADRLLDMSGMAFSRLMEEGITVIRAPGEQFEYSNLGYNLLGRVISNISGERYQHYITEGILRPLGMTATVWETRDVPSRVRALGYSWVEDHLQEEPMLRDGAFGAAAGLSTNAADYARFVAWVLAAWRPERSNESRIVDSATIREAGRGSVPSQVNTRPDGPDGKPCPVAYMCGYGFYVVHDCELGVMLRHPGGLPGFGAQVLLLPQEGVGVFAFANLTYAPLWKPVVASAVRLKRAGLLRGATERPSGVLDRAARAALRSYEDGDVAAMQDEFAANVLLDRSRDRRNSELKSYREQLGSCESITKEESHSALAGRFVVHCARGELTLTLLLSPTVLPKIQYLDFSVDSEPRQH
jgi:CubicO group peptidase (beta-lactamase class C family)